MKICFLAASNSIHSYRWVNYFVDAGHEISWISLVSSTFEIPKSVRYVQLETNGSVIGMLKAALKARKLVAEIKADVLHIHYVGSYGLLGLFSNAPTIVATPWGSDVIEGKSSLVKSFFIRKILRRVKLITCDAYHMRDEVTELGVPIDRVRIINFGIDSVRFSKQAKSEKILKELGVADNELTVISLRSFEPVYDIDNLIRSVPLILKEVPNVRFILIGKGSLEDKLKSLADNLGVSHAINFAGYVANDQLPNTLSSMDVYVSTSLSDAGIAASTAEAMSCELPVVVTDSGENKKWIDDSVNGFLVPVSQPELLAARLIQLLGDAVLRNKFGAEGRKMIQQNNDYCVEMSKMEKLYQEIGGITEPL